MNRSQTCAAAVGLLIGLGLAMPSLAQKQGGILRVFHRDSPASMSILEEGSISAIMPMMGVFNNLVRRWAERAVACGALTVDDLKTRCRSVHASPRSDQRPSPAPEAA